MNLVTEEDIRKWALSMEDLMNDPTGLQEFMNYLEKEYSLENIKFWLAVNNFKKSSELEILQNSADIYNEFLAPGAHYEINIDGKTKEKIHEDMENPSIIMFDDAAEHVYMLLLKKDSYPRFIRSDHYKYLLANGVQHLAKRRGLGGCSAKNYCEERMKGNGCSCMQCSPQSILPSNQLTPCGSAKIRTLSSRASSPLDFFFNNETFSHSRSQSNISDRDNLSYAENRSICSVGTTANKRLTTGSASTPLDDVCPWDSVEYRDIKMPTRDLLMAYDSSGSNGCSRPESVLSRLRWSCCMGRRGPSSISYNQKASNNNVPKMSEVECVQKTPSPLVNRDPKTLLPSTNYCNPHPSSSETYSLKTSPSVNCNLMLLAKCIPISSKICNPKMSPSSANCNPKTLASSTNCCKPKLSPPSTNYYNPKSPSLENRNLMSSSLTLNCNPIFSKKFNPKPSSSTEKCNPKIQSSSTKNKQNRQSQSQPHLKLSAKEQRSQSQLLSPDKNKLNLMKFFTLTKKPSVTPVINISPAEMKDNEIQEMADVIETNGEAEVAGAVGKEAAGTETAENVVGAGEMIQGSKSKAWQNSLTVKLVRKSVRKMIKTNANDV